jgi:DNA-binding transcriptional ArsR family regulator
MSEIAEAVLEPTRRRVVEALAAEPLRTSDLAERLEVSVPALSRHLKVLRERGVVARVDVEGDGRGRRYQLEPAALEVLEGWASRQRWSAALGAVDAGPATREHLKRVGAFLDGFAAGDAEFFERHIADDALFIFPGSVEPMTKTETVASVAGHAPFVRWEVQHSHLRALSPGLDLVTIAVLFQTTASAAPTPIVQTMIFDDRPPVWQLRFLQQTNATNTNSTSDTSDTNNREQP